jgi:multicomponent Na+:H+ antiporter subunit E
MADPQHIDPNPGPTRIDFSTSQQHPEDTTPSRRASFLITFGILAGFWLIFSGRFDLFHLVLGAVSCTLVAVMSHDLLFPAGIEIGLFTCWLRFAAFIPWLFYQILLANLHVLYLTLHPRMMDLIDPHLMEFNTTLHSDIARTTFANSITLTPGTITVKVSVMGKFVVHCIDKASGEPLPGEMQRRIETVFQK